MTDRYHTKVYQKLYAETTLKKENNNNAKSLTMYTLIRVHKNRLSRLIELSRSAGK